MIHSFESENSSRGINTGKVENMRTVTLSAQNLLLDLIATEHYSMPIGGIEKLAYHCSMPIGIACARFVRNPVDKINLNTYSVIDSRVFISFNLENITWKIFSPSIEIWFEHVKFLFWRIFDEIFVGNKMIWRNIRIISTFRIDDFVSLLINPTSGRGPCEYGT